MISLQINSMSCILFCETVSRTFCGGRRGGSLPGLTHTLYLPLCCLLYIGQIQDKHLSSKISGCDRICQDSPALCCTVPDIGHGITHSTAQPSKNIASTSLSACLFDTSTLRIFLIYAFDFASRIWPFDLNIEAGASSCDMMSLISRPRDPTCNAIALAYIISVSKTLASPIFILFHLTDFSGNSIMETFWPTLFKCLHLFFPTMMVLLTFTDEWQATFPVTTLTRPSCKCH